jgi:hypothetical protein
MSTKKAVDKVDSPDPSIVESQLMAGQKSFAVQLANKYEALYPGILAELGLKFEGGNLIKMPWADQYERMTPLQQKYADNQGLILDRLGRALRGDLPVSPALEADFATRREGLSQRLGPDYLQSTPGIQTTAIMDREREIASRGDISELSGIAQAGQRDIEGQKLARAGILSGLIKPGDVLGAYQQALSPYQYYNTLRFQTDLYNVESRNRYRQAVIAAVGGGASAAGSAVAAYYTGGASSAGGAGAAAGGTQTTGGSQTAGIVQ